MRKNLEIKTLIIAMLTYYLAVVFVLFPIIQEEHYAWKDLTDTGYWVVVLTWLNICYWRGQKDWYYSISLNMLNWFCFVSLIDAIYCNSVYSSFVTKHEADMYLDQSIELVNWSVLGGVWAVFNIIFFCIIMPNLPRFLNKED